MSLLKEFRAFLFRGNVIDLAVAVVLGTAFGGGRQGARRRPADADHRADLRPAELRATLSFTINSSHFLYGDFINALITFLSVAVAIFFFVVKPISAMAARRARGEVEPESDTRPCTECLSEIPKAARRCAFCTAQQSPIDGGWRRPDAGASGPPAAEPPSSRQPFL